MKDSEYRRLKRQIEAEYHQKLDALEMVWQMSNTARRNGIEAVSVTPSKKGALLGLIRGVLPEIRGEFTQRTVAEKLREKPPGTEIKRASLSSTLRRLADDGDIELLELGKGKRPSRYRVKQSVRT